MSTPTVAEEHQVQLTDFAADGGEVLIQCSCGWGDPAAKHVRVFHPTVADAYLAWGLHMYDFGYQVGWRKHRDLGEDW